MGTIIGNIIVALLALAGSVYGTYKANAKNQALIAYRLEQLEKKVDRHNQVIERTFKLEESVALLSAGEERTNARLKILEEEKRHE